MSLSQCPSLVIGFVFVSAVCDAADIEQLETRYISGVYELEMSAVLAAPRPQVVAVLTDYANLSQINPAIIVSEMLETDEAAVYRVRTVIRRCVMFYCPKLERVEDVRVLDNGDLNATIVPGMSDFEAGEASWAFEALDQETRIVYRASFDPDFWVPPLIGPPVVKGALREEARVLFTNAERQARAAAGLPIETSE